MLFNSIDFILFFPIVTVLYYVMPKKVRYIWLLVASYYFYMGWNAKYAILLFVSTLVTYLSGIAQGYVSEKYQYDQSKKLLLNKLIVGFSFFINLGILFFFKYFNFTVEIISKALGKLHISINTPSIDVLLPVGISFYTFQALSYTIDVFRGEIYPEKNFFRYALYVSFFPQLVAGPIERSKNLLKQIAVPKDFNFDKARDGFLLMLWGYFLKIVLADRIAVVVDTVYNQYEKFPGWYLIVATVLFAFQIYCDFAGYSTIAIGASEILGIKIMDNFNSPYMAVSVSDFWRRWHISLTSWFRDYLYIPLGGNRKGPVRKSINRMVVFLLSGLWHGASLHFVVWGGINGIYQIIGEILDPFRKRIIGFLRLTESSLGFKLYRIIITFVLVDFSWIFFRAHRLKSAISIARSIITADNPWILFDGSLYKLGIGEKSFRLMVYCILLLVFVDVLKQMGINIRKTIASQDYPVRWVFIVISIFFILTFGIWGPGYNATNFIYFQF